MPGREPGATDASAPVRVPAGAAPLVLGGTTCADVDAVVHWIRNGPWELRRDYDVLDALADAPSHPLIDAAVVRLVDEGPDDDRERMLSFLCLRPNSSLALREGYIRWAEAPWLNRRTSSGGVFGDRVSSAAQSGHGRDLRVVRAFLALGDRYGARTDWTWMAVYADPAGLGIDCLERALSVGVVVGMGEAGALGVTLRDVPLAVVRRAARAFAGQEEDVRNAFWDRLRQMRKDDLTDVRADLGLGPVG